MNIIIDIHVMISILGSCAFKSPEISPLEDVRILFKVKTATRREQTFGSRRTVPVNLFSLVFFPSVRSETF